VGEITVDTIEVTVPSMDAATARDVECWRVGEAENEQKEDPCFSQADHATRYAFVMSCNNPETVYGVWYYAGGTQLRTGLMPEMTTLYFDSDCFVKANNQ
jgi:hypothetical protein